MNNGHLYDINDMTNHLTQKKQPKKNRVKQNKIKILFGINIVLLIIMIGAIIYFLNKSNKINEEKNDILLKYNQVCGELFLYTQNHQSNEQELSRLESENTELKAKNSALTRRIKDLEAKISGHIGDFRLLDNKHLI